jgi:cob(I)alamin adenosyltransferase
MKAKIYTRTGDKGTTHLADGSCVEKFNPRVEAYGTVDELNSYLGLARATGKKTGELPSALDGFLQTLQNQLFNLGSLLACADREVFAKLPAITDVHVAALEARIDELSAELPELRNFILPGGSELSAQLHVARTFCRRAERRAAEVLVEDERYGAGLRFLNRLSDFLFVAARWTNLKAGHNDILWTKSE